MKFIRLKNVKKHFLQYFITISICVIGMIACKDNEQPLPVENTETPIDSPSNGFEWESEHPPLSENTKIAIAAYKKNPTEENKNALLEALNDTYDWVIQNKKDNLTEYIDSREQSINSWMQTIRAGGMPPFMSLNTDNNKGTERQAITEAVDVYRKNRSSENENLVRQALTSYYDAFIREQEEHIIETEELRETRIAAAFEYFTSDRFQPQTPTNDAVKQEDALAEIICAYISVGAEIVPVNPEARVRERTFNAAITSAQMSYLQEPTEENRNKCREEIAKAFQTAYDVRMEEYVKAEGKIGGAQKLFTQIIDVDFRDRQFLDLTEQRNLYGRIDRMVTFGCNTYGNWEPRMKTESQELAALLQEYETSHTTQNQQAVESKFNEIYNEMIVIHKAHLQQMQYKLNSFIEEILKELID